MRNAKDRKRASLIVGVIAACILLDQLTKWVAIHSLRGAAPRVYLGDFFRLQYAENPGAFLSMGSALPDPVRFWVLTVVVGVGLLLLGIYVFRNPSIGTFQTTVLSLILGGGVSNLADRLLRTHGRVIDFMNMGIGELRTGIFNIADVAIMIGVIVMSLSAFLEPRAKPRKQ